MGTDPLPEKAKSDDFNLKKALWAENDKEILDKAEDPLYAIPTEADGAV